MPRDLTPERLRAHARAELRKARLTWRLLWSRGHVSPERWEEITTQAAAIPAEEIWQQVDVYQSAIDEVIG